MDRTAGAWLSSIQAAIGDLEATKGNPEATLAAAARLSRYAEHLVADLVADARAAEPAVSWARIGGALGISRQAANERYSPAGQEGAAARRYRRARRSETGNSPAARSDSDVDAPSSPPR